MIICYIEIIPKIRISNLTQAYSNLGGYAEFIENVGKVISSQPFYSQPFYSLVEEIIETENIKKTYLAEIMGYSRTTLYDHLDYTCNDKYITIIICIALGLDLVSTMIFLMSKGFILNPIINAKDKRTMEFLNSYDRDDDSRAICYRVEVLKEVL